jgi:hypothetical protein
MNPSMFVCSIIVIKNLSIRAFGTIAIKAE